MVPPVPPLLPHASIVSISSLVYQEGQLEEARLELEAAVKVVADAADLHELLHLGLF